MGFTSHSSIFLFRVRTADALRLGMLFLRVWSWLKKYWMWVLFPVGIAAFFWRLAFWRAPAELVYPEVSLAEKERRRAQEAADRQVEQAEEKREREVEQVRAHHAEVLEALTQEQVEKVRELEADPAKLNEFLLSVGRSVRN